MPGLSHFSEAVAFLVAREASKAGDSGRGKAPPPRLVTTQAVSPTVSDFWNLERSHDRSRLSLRTRSAKRRSQRNGLGAAKNWMTFVPDWPRSLLFSDVRCGKEG